MVSQFDKKRELLYASIPMKAYSEILEQMLERKIVRVGVRVYFKWLEFFFFTLYIRLSWYHEYTK